LSYPPASFIESPRAKASTLLTVYSFPRKNEINLLEVLPPSQELNVVGRNTAGDWLAIALASNLDGWVKVDDIDNPPPVQDLSIVTPTSLR
jgi:hypothetical protein